MTVWWLPPIVVILAVAGRAGTTSWWARRARRRLDAGRGRPPVRRARWAGAVGAVDGWARRAIAGVRRRRGLADDVAPTLDELARSVGSGLTLAAAIGTLGSPGPARPFAATLTRALDHHHLGIPLADALGAVAGDVAEAGHAGAVAHASLGASEPEARLGLAVLETAARHGGATAATLDRTAAAVRERRAVVAERAVQSAQARMSALVLTVLPLGFSAWTAGSDRRVGRFLFGSVLGWACLGVGLGCNLLGWAWMRRIVRGRP